MKFVLREFSTQFLRHFIYNKLTYSMLEKLLLKGNIISLIDSLLKVKFNYIILHDLWKYIFAYFYITEGLKIL